MKASTIGDLKEGIQSLDTCVLQWINANPQDRVQQILQDAHSKLEKCSKMCEAPLRLALVGETNSGHSLLLSAFLDTVEIFPGISQGAWQNVLEVRVTFKKEEKPIRCKGATVFFLDEESVWKTLNAFLQDLASKGANGNLPKTVNSPDDLPKLEDALVGAYGKAKDASGRASVHAALEFVLALKHNQNVGLREQSHSCPVSNELIKHALNWNNRPEAGEGIEACHRTLNEMHEELGAFNINAELTEKDLHALFPLIDHVLVDVEAWGAPFGIEEPKTAAPLSLLCFPEAGKETVTAKEKTLCSNKLKESHAVLVVLNGANPDPGNISALIGKGIPEKTIAVVNRCEEAHLSSEGNLAQAMNPLLGAAKNFVSGAGKQSPIYLCSTTCYLLDAKSKRGNWNFGKNDWFSDSKRQAAYTAYKRTDSDFKKLTSEGKGDTQSKQPLQRYADGAGIPALRQEAVAFARDKGERFLKEDILKEFRAAYRMVDEISPSLQGGEQIPAVNSEVSFRSQEFYRILELAVADALPGGTSEYKKLKIKEGDQDLYLWDIIETEITSQVASWPEWFAILNQTTTKKSAPPAASSTSQKPQKVFSRYDKIKKAAGEVPTEFKAFNDRFMKTAEALSEFALKRIGDAVLASIQRFESHPDYVQACQSLQAVIHVDKLSQMEEGTPILDAWQPSRMVEEALVPEILERISDEVDDLKNIRYPYDADKPCFWNLALIVRVQVQLVKTLRDKVSRLIAAAENQFHSFFVNEVLRAEILPLVRSYLNDTNFLATIATAENAPKESPTQSSGQTVRSALERINQQLSFGGRISTPSSLASASKTAASAPKAGDAASKAAAPAKGTPAASAKGTPAAPAKGTPAASAKGTSTAPAKGTPTAANKNVPATPAKQRTPQDEGADEEKKTKQEEGFDEW
jgi:hypothetical protein